jgi:hypothetical protein
MLLAATMFFLGIRCGMGLMLIAQPERRAD